MAAANQLLNHVLSDPHYKIGATEQELKERVTLSLALLNDKRNQWKLDKPDACNFDAAYKELYKIYGNICRDEYSYIQMCNLEKIMEIVKGMNQFLDKKNKN